MKVIESEQVIYCDIDETLIIWDVGATPCTLSVDTRTFHNPYTRVRCKVAIHRPNLEVLLGRLVRGATIVLHSASGYKWAAEAARVLELDNNPNIIVMSKPVAYIDDKPCEKWMGDHIYLKPDDRYGRGS